jgi:hypothetical protein
MLSNNIAHSTTVTPADKASALTSLYPSEDIHPSGLLSPRILAIASKWALVIIPKECNVGNKCNDDGDVPASSSFNSSC